MIRTISIALASAGLFAVLVGIAACATTPPPPPTAASVCEALRPDMPVKYHAKTTDAETIANIRRGNARFAAACPEGGR